ncbi:hypothetical protein EC9_25090 [Rosistilla ulvae]|uniref:Uncharacterized protein n=1 Tax=Rosistilla ulvae TaxID=1930277 RepID=A0A517M0G6_9BACT|nr:hypothetical protein EC9_25090 [Rosistilla ulvae]
MQIATASGARRVSQAFPFPFALVGSHPGCQIHLADSSLPDVVGLVCVFGSQVEITPLVPKLQISVEAFNGGVSFHVGKNRITVRVETPPNGSRPAVAFQPPDLELTYLHRRRRLRLHRRVTLIGADHPSSLRLRSVGLQPCQGALIVVEDQLWYLSLCPADHAVPRAGATWQNLTDVMFQVGAVGIGRFHRPADPFVVRPWAVARRHRSAPRTQEGDLVLAKSKKKGRPTPPRQSIDPDLLTAQIMRRTQSLGRWRWLKQRFLWGIIITLTTALSTYTIVEIWKAVRRRNMDIELELPALEMIKEWIASHL